MTNSFTPDEVQTVVDQLVRSTIRRPRDTLGTRRTDVTFSDTQEAAAGAFLLYPQAPFYVTSLSSSRLKELVQATEVTVISLLTALRVLRRHTLPIRDVSSLVDAKVALASLGGVVAARTSGTDVTAVPAYGRFTSSVDRFLKAAGGNIKDSTGIVPTPTEARADIPGLVTSLQQQVGELVRRVLLIKDGVKDYGSLGLADLLANGVISRAHAMLASRSDQLSAMSEADRMLVIRQTVLELLGMKAVIAKFGSFGAPASSISITGNGRTFADATRPADGALLKAEVFGPYALVAGADESSSTNILYIYVDGASTYPAAPQAKVYLPTSLYAKVEGMAPGPYVITTGVNDRLHLLCDTVSHVVCVLTPGTRTAAQIATDINTALVGYDFKGETFFSPLGYDGQVTIGFMNDLTLPFGGFPTLSVDVGYEVDIYFGDNAPTTRTVTVVSPSTSNPQTILLDGAPLLPSTTDRIQYGSASRKVRLVPTNKVFSVQHRRSIQVKQTNAVETATATTLGFFGEVLGKSTPTDASTVVDYLNRNARVVTAELNFESLYGPLLIRSEPTDPLTMVAYFQRTTATWGAGTDILVTLTEPSFENAVAGMFLVLRGGYNPDEVGLITGINDGTSLSVTFTTPITAVTSATVVESMPMAAVVSGDVVKVNSGVNAGRYYVDTPHPTIPGQFKVRSGVPQYKDGFDQPVLMTGEVGEEGIALRSPGRLLNSEVEVYDRGTTFFTHANPDHAVTKTPYFQLPSLPGDLKVGDILELYTSDPEAPLYTETIARIDPDGVLLLNDSLGTDLVYAFGSVTPPYAVLKLTHVADFTAYSDKLLAWSQKDVQALYFRDLTRFINPLMSNTNPPDADVGAAENRVRDLYQLLTLAGATSRNADPLLSLEGIIGSYTVGNVPEIDNLIKAFKEKGADRAVDLLLECQFSTFFGLNQDETSYSGAFQQAVRDVARNDLPVHKTNREATSHSQLKATTQGDDYETSSADLDKTPLIDPPAGIDQT